MDDACPQFSVFGKADSIGGIKGGFFFLMFRIAFSDTRNAVKDCFAVLSITHAAGSLCQCGFL